MAPHVISSGTVLPFEDGHDMLFVPHGQSIDAAMPEWKRLSDLRRLALGALKHQANRKGYTLELKADGTAEGDNAGSSFSFSIAGDLTHALRQHEPEQALVEFTKHLWSLRIQSTKIARGLLARATADPHPASLPRRPPDHSLGDAISLLASVAPMDWLTDWNCDVESGLQQAKQRLETPNTALLVELRRRLPPETVFVELTKPGTTSLGFPDEGDSLDLVPHSRRTSRRLAEKGVAALADEIIARREHLGTLRSQALAALDHLLASAGLSEDTHIEGRAYGHVHVEAVLKSGRPLTLGLGRHGIETTLRRWWASQPALPVLNDELWQQALTQPEKKPAKRSLLSKPLPPSQPQADFHPLKLAQTDARADAILAMYRHRVETGLLPLHAWSQPWLYHPGRDTWTDETWWLKAAQAAWSRNRDQTAAAILLANGDDSPREAILTSWRELDGYWDEACDDQLMWQLWNDLPWRVPDGSRPRFSFTRGSLPPEIAWRLVQRTRRCLGEAPDEGFQHPEATIDQLPAADAHEWFSAEEIEKVRQHSLERASATQSMVMLHPEILLTAQNMGWSDIATLISENPLTLASIDQLDGISPSSSAEWAVRLSAVQPTPFTARLALRHLSRTDADILRQIEEENEKLQKMMAEACPDLPPQSPKDRQEQLDFSIRQSFEYLHKAAIAWHRWRTQPVE
jgi:hypothetical protein